MASKKSNNSKPKKGKEDESRLSSDNYKLLRTRKDGWQVYAALAPLVLYVTAKHIMLAVRCDKENCVVAQALRDHFMGFVSKFQVGTRLTNLICEDSKIVMKFSTSSPLSKSIKLWDKTGLWDLPPGAVTLLPLSKSYQRGDRFTKMKHSGGKKSMAVCVRGETDGPTRFGTVCSAMKQVG